MPERVGAAPVATSLPRPIRESDWPLRTHLELGALPTAVPCTRLHVRQRLWEWGLTELSAAAELLVTELVTNAVHAARSCEWPFPVEVWLFSNRVKVMILVWDGNHNPPVRADAAVDDENGRGLLLVEAVSEQWGWYQPVDRIGKVVWCLSAN